MLIRFAPVAKNQRNLHLFETCIPEKLVEKCLLFRHTQVSGLVENGNHIERVLLIYVSEGESSEQVSKVQLFDECCSRSGGISTIRKNQRLSFAFRPFRCVRAGKASHQLRDVDLRCDRATAAVLTNRAANIWRKEDIWFVVVTGLLVATRAAIWQCRNHLPVFQISLITQPDTRCAVRCCRSGYDAGKWVETCFCKSKRDSIMRPCGIRHAIGKRRVPAIVLKPATERRSNSVQAVVCGCRHKNLFVKLICRNEASE